MPHMHRSRPAAPGSWLRRCVTGAALAGVALGLLTGPAVAVTAGPPPATGPASAYPAPATVETYSPYLGQVSCDPAAKPGTVALAEVVLAHYGQGRSSGISRACEQGGRSEHKEGRAWDWALDVNNPAHKAAADEFVAWLVADGPDGKPGWNARRLGVMYVIWNRQTWSSYKADQGLLPYTGSSPHTDHVHVSLSWAGAMKRTSFWTGRVAATDYGPCVAVEGQLAPPYTAPNPERCPAPVRLRFWDVPQHHSFFTEIQWLADQKITEGRADGSFGVTDTITRAEMAAFLYRHARPAWYPASTQQRFTDVPLDHPFATEIGWLADQGISRGVRDGTAFDPRGTVTRHQMAAFLHRALGAQDGYVTASPTVVFADVPPTSSWYEDVVWLAASGITTGSGDGTVFQGEDPVTRGQMAAFLYRASNG